MHTKLTISQSNPAPMYAQIMEQIRRRVALGDWKPGQEMPSIRALAAATRVSVITVKRAYLELEHEGVIVTRQGVGTFVADKVELGRQLREQELDQHLDRAVEVAHELGMGSKALQGRLNVAFKRHVADQEPDES